MFEQAFCAYRKTSNCRNALIRVLMVAASYTHKGVPNCWANLANVEGVNVFIVRIMSNTAYPINHNCFLH